jgi:recombination protein RecR
MYQLPPQVQKLADILASLPGIGPKQANKLALYLATYGKNTADNLQAALPKLHQEIAECSLCGNLTQTDICSICADTTRDQSVVMVVESVLDLIALENANYYQGVYCVLGKLISPIHGVMPDDTNLRLLFKRPQIAEVIFALPATVEGEATTVYIQQQLQHKLLPVPAFTQLARGIGRGVNVEYVDPETLKAALINRQK